MIFLRLRRMRKRPAGCVSFGVAEADGDEKAVDVVAGEDGFAFGGFKNLARAAADFIAFAEAVDRQMLSFERILLQPVEVFLQAEVVFRDQHGVRQTDIAVMPRFAGNPRHSGFLLRVPLNKAVPPSVVLDPDIRPFAGKIIAQPSGLKIEREIHRQPGVMFAFAGVGDILFGVVLTLFTDGLVPQAALLIR